MKNKLLCLMSILLTLCGCSKKDATLSDKDSLKIVVTSDLHYLDASCYENYSYMASDLLKGDGKMTNYSDAIMDSFIAQMQIEQPDLIVVTGDLTFNGEKKSHEALVSKFNTLKEAGIEVALINGNHDVGNFFARSFDDVNGSVAVDTVDRKDFKAIYDNLCYKNDKSIDDNSLSYRLDLNHQYSLIVLDTNSVTYQQNSGISKDTMSWLETQLKDITEQNKVPLVAMHHNLAIHSELLYAGYTIDNQEEMLALFKQYNVPLTMSGHIHMQHIAKADDIYDIASGSLSISPVQYGVITLTPQAIDYHTDILENIEGDEQFFEKTYYNRTYPKLIQIFDEKTSDELANYLAKANRLYFSGMIYTEIDALKEDPRLDILTQHKDELDFNFSYLMSQLSQTTNHQNLHIDLD